MFLARTRGTTNKEAICVGGHFLLTSIRLMDRHDRSLARFF
jgi:hypothetical protein